MQYFCCSWQTIYIGNNPYVWAVVRNTRETFVLIIVSLFSPSRNSTINLPMLILRTSESLFCMAMSNLRFAKQCYFDNCPFMPTGIFACGWKCLWEVFLNRKSLLNLNVSSNNYYVRPSVLLQHLHTSNTRHQARFRLLGPLQPSLSLPASTELNLNTPTELSDTGSGFVAPYLCTGNIHRGLSLEILSSLH